MLTAGVDRVLIVTKPPSALAYRLQHCRDAQFHQIIDFAEFGIGKKVITNLDYGLCVRASVTCQFLVDKFARLKR